MYNNTINDSIVIESKLVDNKEQAGLAMHYYFDHEDISKEIIDSYIDSFPIEVYIDKLYRDERYSVVRDQ